MAFFSTSSADYTSQIKNLTKPTYASKYNNVIQENLNNILNGKKFTYDFNADPLYKNYKEMYSRQGKEAGLSAQATAAGNTGGYGNSYGVTSATEANLAAMEDLSDRIPELYKAAQTQYQNELNNNYNKLQALTTEESRLYSQYRDLIGDYYTDWDNLLSGYGIALDKENADRSYNYQKERDAVLDAQYAEQFAYQKARDQALDAQAAAQLAYQKSRDEAADSQWQQSYQAALSKATGSSSSSSSSAATTTTAAAATPSVSTTASKTASSSSSTKSTSSSSSSKTSSSSSKTTSSSSKSTSSTTAKGNNKKSIYALTK